VALKLVVVEVELVVVLLVYHRHRLLQYRLMADLMLAVEMVVGLLDKTIRSFDT
jgi:hypothetical protein